MWNDVGLCAQQDLLWPNLTTRQHLTIHSELKGFKGQVQIVII